MTFHYFLFWLFVIWALLIFACSQGVNPVTTRKAGFSPQVADISINEPIHFRGLHVLDDTIAWISGSRGTILRTENGGVHWDRDSIEGYTGSDFRDIVGLSNLEALAMSVASPGIIVKTADGGQSWQTQYINTDSMVFMNGMDFWDERNGIVYGDPLHGYHFVLVTNDGGESWHRVQKETLPAVIEPEHAYAACGAGVAVWGYGMAWLGYGGRKARVFRSEDYGHSWKAFETPILQGENTNGIYAMSFKSNEIGMVVGGDYTIRNAPRNTARTRDGGQTWQLLPTDSLGFRSGIEFIEGNKWISVGFKGTYFSEDNGDGWQQLDTLSFNGIEFSPSGRFGIAIGANGLIYSYHVE